MMVQEDAEFADSTGGSLGVESLWGAIEGQHPPELEDPLLGKSFDGLTLIRAIGEGGMGRVYEALQDSPRRLVAVKLLRPGPCSRELMKRFLKESEILGQLNHPCISQIYSAGHLSLAGATLPYFVMELIPDAKPITEYVRDRNLSRREILQTFRDVCDAVAHGHSQGFVHRDLKPSNVLIDGRGRPRVIDFGVARASQNSSEATSLTALGQVIGTLQYMSPEQLSLAPQETDARADVYSLGVLLYELLAGRVPYEVRDKTLIEAARIIQFQEPVGLRACDRTIPWHLAGIVTRALAKDRTKRFTNAADMANAVGQSLDGSAREPFWLIGGLRDLRNALHQPRGRSALGTLMTAGATAAIWLNWPQTPPKPLPAKQTAVNASSTVPVGPSHQSASYEVTGSSFRWGCRDVFQPGADQFLVDVKGMKKWQERFGFPRTSYWAPEANDSEGILVYRFVFPKPTTGIHLIASSPCWDFTREPGGNGRGASALQMSKDGISWKTVVDNIASQKWGDDWSINENLDAEFVGARELWLRLTFLTEDAPVNGGYNVAQFARSQPGSTTNVFDVTASFD